MPHALAGLRIDPGATTRMTITHPVTREPLVALDKTTVANVELLSWDSKEAQEHRLGRDAAERALGRPLTPEEEWEDMGRLLAKLTRAWTLVGLDGHIINAPCTYDLAVDAYNSLETRWLRNQVIACLNSNVHHLPLGGRTGSAPGLDTASG